ncbi:SnoaL-like domain-containing protein [Plasmodiophora brassicae]
MVRRMSSLRWVLALALFGCVLGVNGLQGTSLANRAAVRKLVAACNDHNLKAIMELFDDEAEVHPPCSAGQSASCTLTGRMAIRRDLHLMIRAFPDGHDIIDSIVCDGNTCMTLDRFSATHQGALESLQPFGKRIDNVPVMHVVRFGDNGLIKEMRIVLDYGGILRALSATTDQDRFMQQAWKMGEVWNGVRPAEDLADVLADDYVGLVPADPGPRNTQETRDDVIAKIKLWRSAFPDLQTTCTMSPGSSPRELIARWHTKGTFQNPLKDAQPTGRPVHLVGVSVIEFNADGLVAKGRTIYDTLDLLRQMGVVPQKKGKLVRDL